MQQCTHSGGGGGGQQGGVGGEGAEQGEGGEVKREQRGDEERRAILRLLFLGEGDGGAPTSSSPRSSSLGPGWINSACKKI